MAVSSSGVCLGFALPFPFGEKAKRKEKQQRTAETQLTFLAQGPCLKHWPVTMNEMPVPCLINTSFLLG